MADSYFNISSKFRTSFQPISNFSLFFNFSEKEKNLFRRNFFLLISLYLEKTFHRNLKKRHQTRYVWRASYGPEGTLIQRGLFPRGDSFPEGTLFQGGFFPRVDSFPEELLSREDFFPERTLSLSGLFPRGDSFSDGLLSREDSFPVGTLSQRGLFPGGYSFPELSPEGLFSGVDSFSERTFLSHRGLFPTGDSFSEMTLIQRGLSPRGDSFPERTFTKRRLFSKGDSFPELSQRGLLHREILSQRGLSFPIGDSFPEGTHSLRGLSQRGLFSSLRGLPGIRTHRPHYHFVSWSLRPLVTSAPLPPRPRFEKNP